MNNSTGIIWKSIVALLVIALFCVVTLLISTKILCSDISQSAKKHYVTTHLENGKLSFPASMFVSDEEVKQIMNEASTSGDKIKKGDSISTKVNKNTDGIELVNVSGPTFFAKMLIIKDPSRVKISTIYPWKPRGLLLGELVDKSNSICGVNGGLYYQNGNSGGRPDGVAVCEGEIQYNSTGIPGFHMIGMDKNDKLRVIDLTGKSAKQVEELIKKEGIRDAVGFPDEHLEESNWFANVITDGEARKVDGLRCCINPRTVIGQRADGAVLLLVTDGRGKSSHIGATVVDIIKIMKEYGAVNAANLDGGSSSSMYYNKEYVMPSTTFYFGKSSWYFPTAVVVENIK